MKAKNLVDIWTAPDNTRLTSKQYSFRLPVHVAAKLAALCEMYPTKSRTQIVADLLTTSLDELEESLPSDQGQPFGEDEDTGEFLFEQVGVVGWYRSLTNKHHAELERELGNEKPKPFYPTILVSGEHNK